MRKDSDEHGSENRRVDSDGKVTEAPAGDGRDELVEAPFREEAVSEVEGEGNEETDNDRNRNDEVNGSRRVKVLGEGSPCDSLRVERLYLLT